MTAPLAPGPLPVHPFAAMDDPLSDDPVAGRFRLWQRRRGHRYSIDDVATAFEAVHARPGALRCLDLGAGIGSVLHMLAFKLPDAVLAGIEAQSVSFALLERNVARNGLAARVHLVHGDLREPALLDALVEAAGPFDLVTGTPPYMAVGDGTMPPDSQRAHARMELRGGVEDYLEAAARVLAPGGRAVVCASMRAPERAPAGAHAAGLAPLRVRAVVPRAGRAGALFSVWTCARIEEATGPVEQAPALVARTADGRRTEDADGLRRFFGVLPAWADAQNHGEAS